MVGEGMLRWTLGFFALGLVLGACGTSAPTPESADASSADSGDAAPGPGDAGGRDASPADGGHDGSADAGSGDAGRDSGGDGAAEAGVGDGEAGTGADASSCAAVGSASLTGTFLGNSLVPQDAIAWRQASAATVVLADFANVCSYGTEDLKANSNILSFDIANAQLAAGTTIQVGSSGLDPQYANFDASCGSPEGESAESGSVTITKVDGCAVTGTFDFIFSIDHVSGSFTAADCAPAVTTGTCH
jgi:hypothetical protein